MKTAAVSVVMPTRGRRDLLKRTLPPLLDDPAVVEVIVVMDGDIDGTAQELERLSRIDSRVISCLLSANSFDQLDSSDPSNSSNSSNPSDGRTAARQRGVELATGEIILLIDDDVVSCPNMATGHLEYHAIHKQAVVVGHLHTVVTSERDIAARIYADDYEGTVLKYRQDKNSVLKFLWGGNISIRKADCIKVGLSSPTFTFEYFEDNDFGIRCSEAGLQGIYAAELRAEHLHNRTFSQFIEEAKLRGKCMVDLRKVHPQTMVDQSGPHATQLGALVVGLISRPTPTRLFIHLAPWIFKLPSSLQITYWKALRRMHQTLGENKAKGQYAASQHPSTIVSSIRISIVVDNYNYQDFVGTAIDSALRQTWPNTEVLVVDDGSTDNSRNVIASFGSKITALYKENGGQGSAFNQAFDYITGDVVIFLDADDTLKPNTVEQVALAFENTAGLTRVQWPLEVVNKTGNFTGKVMPSIKMMPSGNLRDHIIRFRTHVWPPQSGNAYSTTALKSLFPIPTDFPMACDLYLAETTALLGPIFSLTECGGTYRVHGENYWTANKISAAKLRENIGWTVANHQHVARLCSNLGISCSNDPLQALDVAFISRRLASLRLDKKNHPFIGDRRFKLTLRGLLAATAHPHHTLAHKLKRIGWIIGVGLGNDKIAKRLIDRFYFSKMC